MADGSIHINTKINRKGAEQDLNDLKKAVDTKVKQLEKGVNSASNEVNKLNEKFNQTSQELSNVENKMDEIGDKVFETYKDFQGKIAEESFDKFIKSQIQADSEYQKLSKKQEELKLKVNDYKTKLNSANEKYSQINTSLKVAKKEQSNINSKLEDTKSKTQEISSKIKSIPKNTKKVAVESLGISKNLEGAVKKLAKYGVTLLGFQGIYSILKSSMDEWLNGSSQSAKQLQTDISNLKLNIGNTLAPAIQSVLQIFYKILAVVGAIVKTFSGINIFAKSTAKSTASTASSSKQISNNLAGFDSLDVLQQDNNSSSGGGAELNPTDLGSLMSQYEELAEKIKNIFAFVFEPFKKAWETTGQAVINAFYNALNGVKSLCEVVGSSFAKIWTNGTVQTTVELLLQILANILNTIGNIANAFSNAWAEGGKGDIIIQSLANAINNILGIIQGVTNAFSEWWKTEKGEQFANAIVGIFEIISGWIQNLTSNIKKIWDEGGKHAFTSILDAGSNIAGIFRKVLENLDPVIKAVQDFAGNALAKLLDAIGWVIDKFNEFADWILGNSDSCDAFAVIIGSIATAILLVVTAITIWNVVGAIAAGVTTALGIAVNILTSPITLVILAIAALIAIVILLYQNWDTISQALSNAWQWLKEKAIEIFTAIGDFLSNLWQSIKDTINIIWTAIKDFFINLWNSIKTAIGNAILGIYNGIVEKFNKVKDFISLVFNAIKEFFTNIWDGIKNIIIHVINYIRNGITNVFNNIKDIITNIFNNVKDFVTNIWNNILNVISKVINNVKNTISNVINVIKSIWESIWNIVSNVVSNIWNGIMNVISNVINWIKNAITNNLNLVKTVWSTVWNAISNVVSNIWNGIMNVISGVINNIKDTISNILNGIKSIWENIWTSLTKTISNVWNTIIKNVKEGVSGAWNAITSVFGNIGNWFKDKFSQAWQAVKNVFSAGGKIFDGIKDGILNGLKSIVNAIIAGINKVIKVPFDGLNSALRSIKGVNIMGLKPFDWIKTIGVPQIPMLAKGGIVNQPTQAIIGEAGKEAVLPLENNTEWMDVLADKIGSRINIENSSSNEIILKFDGTLSQLVRILKPELDRECNRKGNRLVIA